MKPGQFSAQAGRKSVFLLAIAGRMVYDNSHNESRKKGIPMITPEMRIFHVMQMDPKVAPIFMSFGMHCLFCPHAAAETLADACATHGVDVNELVAKLNEHFESQK